VKLKVALVLALLPTLGISAQQQTFTVDTGQSEVHMKLNTTHEVVNGTFRVQSGMIQFDRASSQMEGAVVVAAGSGDTGNGSRDKKMKNDVLRVGQFSTVSFSPKTYSGKLASAGDSTIQVTGVFELLGSSHVVTIPMHVQIDGSVATAKAQFSVPYVQWGLKNPSFLFWKADNDVVMDLRLRGLISR